MLAAMAAYTFHFIDADGHVRAFDVKPCDSEAEARAWLPQLFALHDSCAVIEVRDEADRMVVRAERAAA